MPLKVEYELPNPPTDGISNVRFAPAPSSPLLLASSWDKSVRLYNTATVDTALRCTYHHPYAVLDCCFSDVAHSFSVGLDKALISYDFGVQKQFTLGTYTYLFR